LDIFDRLLLFTFAIFNLYMLWRVNRIEQERPSYEDIKNIFQIMIDEIESKENYE